MNVRFEILTEVSIKIILLWDMATCILADRLTVFWSSLLLQDISICLPNYWVSISKPLLSLILRPQKEVPWMVGMIALIQKHVSL
jgi:hypothetical protein